MSGEAEVLLVEDNPADAELILYSLLGAKLPAKIEVVHDGHEALEYLFCRGSYSQRSPDSPPRLVLLDIKLPKVNGLEVLRQLKFDPRTQFIPIVMLTSSNVERDIVDGYRYRANSYVQKPVDFDRLRDVIIAVGRYWLNVNEPPPSVAYTADSR
jgi:two-component system, response regulator